MTSPNIYCCCCFCVPIYLLFFLSLVVSLVFSTNFSAIVFKITERNCQKKAMCVEYMNRTHLLFWHFFNAVVIVYDWNWCRPIQGDRSILRSISSSNFPRRKYFYAFHWILKCVYVCMCIYHSNRCLLNASRIDVVYLPYIVQYRFFAKSFQMTVWMCTCVHLLSTLKGEI